MRTLKLIKPIMINNQSVSELKYDFENMTAMDRLRADGKAKELGIQTLISEVDSSVHLIYFAAACEKADREVTIDDVLRISHKDSMAASGLSRNFIYGLSEVYQPEKTSESLSEA